jgi:hypothetical protein
MSAARAGVSAVAISMDPNNALVKDFMAMAFPPLSQPARNHPAFAIGVASDRSQNAITTLYR